MSDVRLAELRVHATDGYAVLGSTLAEALAEVDRLRAALGRVTGEAMVQYLAEAQHRRTCAAPGGLEACEIGSGPFVYDAEKVVELIDELAQEEEQDDAQQRSEQAEEAELRDGLTESQHTYFEILESLDESGRMRFRIARAKAELRKRNEAQAADEARI